MRVNVFTKLLGSISVAQLAADLAELGVDGADLVVRDGQTVTPADPAGILAVAKALRHNGLELDVVTTELLDGDATAEGILAACADAGVGLVRAGFYSYEPAEGYQRCLDQARKGLASLAQLAAKHGVRVALQLHHRTIHPSAAHALRLIDDLDDVLVYADPGNQAKEGSEDWRMSLDLLGDRLANVGVKDAGWQRTPEGWECDWVPLADGIVPWQEIIPGLRERGYAGPLSLHIHYPTSDPLAALRADAAQLRTLLGERS